MIVSGTLSQKTSRWLQACVLLCATALLPLGIASAQDDDSVAERPKQIVEAQEVSDATMAIREKEMAREGGEEDELQAYLKSVWARLQVAVAEGGISAEDAEAKMAAIKREKGVDASGAGDWDRDEDDWDEEEKEEYYKAIGARIEAAVEAGELTEEEAKAKWREITEEDEDDWDKDWDGEEYYEEISKKLKAAVEAGELTEEEAEEKLIAVREKMWPDDDDDDQREE